MDTRAETTFALIEGIRKRPILYNKATRYENRRVELKAAWEEVSKSLGAGTTISTVKARWKYLRNEHGRFLRSGRIIKIPGIHERLSFLNPFLLNRQNSECTQVKYEDGLEYSIQLVNCVRQYPCLYDGSNPDAKNSAWKEVVAKLAKLVKRGANIRSCMFRWNKMRYNYIYFLKKGCIAKPEGIAPYLAFLKPFVNLEPIDDEELTLAKQLADIVRQYPALYSGSQSTLNTALWNEVAQLMGGKVSAQLCSSKWAWLRSNYERHLKTGNRMVPYGIDSHLTFLDAFIEIVPAAVRSVDHLRADKTDPDVHFLLELLHSMAKMGEPQKRLFRIEAVKASQAVFEDD